METEALKATEEYSAARSTHPRVSLADINAAIVCENYFTVGEALDALGQPAPDSTRLLTLAIVTVQNGFVFVGKSAPASPENFDAEKGRVFAYEDAVKQIWPAMGYALRDRLAAQQGEYREQ